MNDAVDRTVPRERHDPVHQQRLRTLATEVVVGLTTQSTRPALILLIGSAARGPVARSSDVDILVADHAPQRGLLTEEWFFSPDGTAINVRRTDVQTLSRISSAHDEEFANFCVTTWLPDHLYGHEVLFVAPDDQSVAAVGLLAAIVDRRQDPPNVRAMCALLRQKAIDHIHQAIKHLEGDEPADAHAALRMVGGCLLEEELVASTTVVRGSKKRPELLLLAVGCERHPVVDFVGAVTGFASLDPSAAATLASVRLQHRDRARQVVTDLATVLETHSMRRLASAWSAHSRYANDYYESLVADGFWRGVVNHIRCHSGIPRFPAQFMEALCGSRKAPVSAFLECGTLPRDFRSEWRWLSGTDIDMLHLQGWLATAQGLIHRPPPGVR